MGTPNFGKPPCIMIPGLWTHTGGPQLQPWKLVCGANERLLHGVARLANHDFRSMNRNADNVRRY